RQPDLRGGALDLPGAERLGAHRDPDHARARHRALQQARRPFPRRKDRQRRAPAAASGGPLPGGRSLEPRRRLRRRSSAPVRSLRPGPTGARPRCGRRLMRVILVRSKNVLKVGLRAIVRNKMRSALTMLGIIIGVACVIAMVAVASGASRSIQSSITSLGTNFIMIF